MSFGNDEREKRQREVVTIFTSSRSSHKFAYYEGAGRATIPSSIAKHFPNGTNAVPVAILDRGQVTSLLLTGLFDDGPVLMYFPLYPGTEEKLKKLGIAIPDPPKNGNRRGQTV